MRKLASFPAPTALRIAALGALAFSVSACSQADRFAYDPFSNPFNGKETTGSLPSGGVSSQPLPPPGGGTYQPASYGGSAPAYAPQQTYNQPYQPPYQQQAAASAPQHSAPPPSQPQYKYSQAQTPGWSAQGGQSVTVQPGDTVYSLGARHGVPASTILQANNLPPNAQLNAGQRITIPGYRGQANAAQTAQAPKPQAPVAQAPAVQAQKPRVEPVSAGRGHIVQPGETLFSISRKYNVSARELASANNVDMNYHVRTGEKVSVPGTATVAPAVHRQPETATARVEPAVQRKEAPRETYAALSQPAKTMTDTAPAAAPVAPVAATSSAGGTDFRWPVRGRVISNFGKKPDGQSNDGVNISVPEGTEIKAAEGGVVAYAGNELKGFGNLVLIRHGGEWVTAYAHASEIMVKRGDVVRRGQVIAKAGRTGNVNAPQLHFEVRRGASPVDPLSHLPKG